MEKNYQRQVCYSDSSGVQASTEIQTPYVQESGIKIRNLCSKKSRVLHSKRSGKTQGRRGHRKSNRQNPGVLSSFLHSAKAPKKSKEAHIEHEALQQEVYVQSYIQDDKCKECERNYPAWRSRFFGGPEKCLSYFADLQTPQEISEIYLEGGQVPISILGHGSLYQPQGLYQGHKTHPTTVQGERFQNLILSGRLSGVGQGYQAIQKSQEVLTQVTKRFRSDSKLGKKSVGSTHSVHLHRCNLGHHQNVNGHPRGQASGYKGCSSGNSGNPIGHHKKTSKVHGSSKFCSLWSKRCKKDGQGYPSIHNRKLWKPQRLIQKSQVASECKSSVVHLEKHWTQPSQNSTSSSPSGASHRCYTNKLGLSFAGPRGPPHIKSRRIQSKFCGGTYKSLRITSSSDCSKTASKSHSWKAPLSTNRQSGSKIISNKSRRYKVSSTLQKGLSDLGLSGYYKGRFNSKMGQNQFKSGSRLRVKGQKVPRVVSKPYRVLQDQCQAVDSDRSDGLSQVDPMSDLFHPTSGRPTGTGGGLFQSGLELSNNVLFSTPSACSDNTEQVSAVLSSKQTQTVDSSGPMLDDIHLDTHSNKSTSYCTKETEIQTVPDSRPGDRQLSDQVKSIKTKACGMDIMRQVLKSKGFSTLICQKVSESITLSTQRSYNTAWQEWDRWNVRKCMDPMWLSVVKLSSFLSYLFRHGLAWNTIGIYRSSICSILQPHKNRTCASSPIIKKLMKGFFKKRPPKRKKFTPWDVQKVLKKLASMGPPSDLDNKQLSWKTATLVALATGKRVADMSLMSISQAHMFLGRDQIIFNLLPGSKTDRPNHLSNQVTLYRNRKNPSLCPVYYLKQYLIRTEPFRSAEGSSKLWIGCNAAKKPVCTATIASWIKTIITSAKAQLSPGAIRSVVASISYANNVSINQILEAGDWSSVNTVNNHYFRFYTSPSNYRADAVQRAVLQIS